MSDRCWFAVHVRKEDAQLFRKLVADEGSLVEEPPDPCHPNAVFFRDPEAYYGHYDACEKAAACGLAFDGACGPGSESPPGRFCGIDGRFYYSETLEGGAPTVRFGEEKRQLDLSALSGVERYLYAYDRVRLALGDRR